MARYVKKTSRNTQSWLDKQREKVKREKKTMLLGEKTRDNIKKLSDELNIHEYVVVEEAVSQMAKLHEEGFYDDEVA